MRIDRFLTQLKDTIYWYWCRRSMTGTYIFKNFSKEYTNRNGYQLASTWDLDYNLSNLIDAKISHALYNIRKYGHEQFLYIDSSKIIAFGTDEDKKFIFDKSLKDCEKRTKRVSKGLRFWAGTSNNHQSIFIYPEENDNYTLRSFNGVIIQGPYNSEKLFDALQTIKSNPDEEFENLLDSFIYIHDVSLNISDLKNISSELRQHIRGQYLVLRTLWQFRKMLRLYAKKNLENTYRQIEYPRIFKIKERTKELVCKEAEFEEARLKDLQQIIEYFNKYVDYWWD